MLAEFQKHINDNFQELLTKRFLLACSGGIDSMVLVSLCMRSSLDFVIAHCNFQLRGVDSIGDEEFVHDFAKENNIPVCIKSFETDDYISQHKVSVQMAARELRYAWFTEIMEQDRIETLVTAHHADDSLETFLINLSRGTGIDGLTGIPAKTDTISRPLLAFSKGQIEAYAQEEDLHWREDSSNAETKYLRNKIRHDIVPLLKELHPTFLGNFKATQDHLSGSSEILSQHIDDWKQKHFEYKDDGIVKIAITDLTKLRPLKPYLYLLLKDYGFNRVYDDIAVLLAGLSGKEVRSSTHRLVKNREYLLLEELEEHTFPEYQIGKDETTIEHPIVLKIEEVVAIGETAENVLYVDKETLKYPLTVRKWKNGDYFYPLGMRGKKKLSKYFKDEKVDVIAKRKQWLLYSENQLVWVIGRRADNRFRVTESTNKIVKITFN